MADRNIEDEIKTMIHTTYTRDDPQTTHRPMPSTSAETELEAQ